MEDVGFLPTATTHLRKLRILGLWSLKLLWKKVLPHAIMVVRDEILFANLIDFPSFFKYFSGFLFAFASTGGWWSLVFLAALIRHVHAVLDHTPSPLGTRSHSPKSATKRSQRVSKRALLPSQESVAVATLVILSLTPIRMIQELSESLHINTLYMYCIKCVYIYIYCRYCKPACSPAVDICGTCGTFLELPLLLNNLFSPFAGGKVCISRMPHNSRLAT